MRIKVGMMPGRLVEVEVNEGLTAREIFARANVELSNHEVRLDGDKIELDTVINNGGLLVAMKMIKGNAKTIKVGIMPGRLEVVEYEEGMRAYEIFEKANVSVSNHEIRLDGETITLDKAIENGSLLVAMKMIKGNSEVYITDCTEKEIEMLLEVALPTQIEASCVKKVGEGAISVNISGMANEEIIVEEDMFNSVYTLKEQVVLEVNNINELEKVEIDTTSSQIPVLQYTPQESQIRDFLEKEMLELEKEHKEYIEKANDTIRKIGYVKDMINKLARGL